MPLPKNLPQSVGGESSPKKERTAVQVVAQRYRVERRMGSGAFGTAFLVTDLKDRKERKVLKQIGVADLLPDETVGAVKEARLLSKLDHPSIVKFHDSFLEKEFFCIVTELCEGGDLDQKIRQWQESGRSFDETLIVDWFIQLTTAIMYIHERRILHRDLKTRNIFLKNDFVKLGDFGISRILLSTTDLASTFTGTPHYMSPEALKQNGYNSKSDIWSLGAVLYELCTLRRAFSGTNLMAVMYKIVEGERPDLPATVNPALRALFARMLEKDPRKRPSAVAILQEPFLRQRMKSLQATQLTATALRSSKEEAQAIAKALTPVKKRSLKDTSDGPPLTPRQQLAIRKKQKADSEVEERIKLAAQNYSEGKKRFSQQKKDQGRVVPPWLDEHPDVFSDPNFSITQLETRDSDSLAHSLEAALPLPEQLQEEEEEEVIPDDPSLAESHYSQFDDFEDEVSSSSEDEYDALMECIESALDLHDQPLPESPPVSPHDELCPFSVLAREKKIDSLRLQCIKIFGEEVFLKIYAYLSEARSHSAPDGDETDMVSGLKLLTSNTRDCFLIDQLVFLERNTTTFS